MSKEVTVSELPNCDLCGKGTEAEYDAKTIWGSWMNLCEDHFHKYGIGLGTELGQKLIKNGSSRV